MQVVALIGFVQYEGSDLLGVYADHESAKAALEAFRGTLCDQYDEFMFEVREIGAPADPIMGIIESSIRTWEPATVTS